MPADMWDNSTGHTQVSALMATDSLDSLPLNMSRIDSNVLLLRGYYVNRSDASNGQFGVESFQDVFLKWQQAQPAGVASDVPIAAIVAPIVVAAALAALAAAMLVVWRRRKAAAAAAGAAHSSGGKGDLLPRVFADASRYSSDKLSRNDSDTGPSPDSAVLAARSADQMRTHSNTSSLTSLSKAKSGPSQDIALACKNLVLHRTANEPDELILQSVLGEGSYGKVGTPLLLLVGLWVAWSAISSYNDGLGALCYAVLQSALCLLMFKGTEHYCCFDGWCCTCTAHSSRI
jgi:hypothetical protein